MIANRKNIHLPDIIGKHYKRFWNFKGYYLVCKGSRGSKKSKTAALRFIYNLMKYPESNLLVVRKTFRTLKDSCFTELKWAINRLGVMHLWNVTESPLEMTYIPTGQTIYFRGLDDPLKITSITVEIGSLCWMWIEEAYEIMNEADFNMIDESIRGKVGEGLFKQIVFTFNPWNEKHWLKRRFFDMAAHETIVEDFESGIVKEYIDEEFGETIQTLAMTTNYLMNEWLDNKDLVKFNLMKKQNPRRFLVAGLGNWGIVEGVIYENWREERFSVDEIRKHENVKSVFGLDFGYTNDPSALFCGLVNVERKKIWVFDEMYEHGMSNKRIFDKVTAMGFGKERIIADSAEPKSIDELDNLGMYNIRKARKGKDSRKHGIQYIQDFEIIVHPDCVNFITEISNYTWDDDKFGNKINEPIEDFNHLMDAMRYAMEQYSRGATFSFD